MQVPQRSQPGARGAPNRAAAETQALATPQGQPIEAAMARAAARVVHARRAGFEVFVFPLFLGAIAVSLGVGWMFRDQIGIESEAGVGYWLGVAGLSCVGLLLIYPLRKRLPKLALIGSVPAWFHLHMSLGLLAPALILFHAGFRTGSVNALVALVSMLVVAGSGVLGRMLYVRIHRGLTGAQAEARTMAADAAVLRQTMVRDFTEVANISEALEATLRIPPANVFSAFFYAITASQRIARAQVRMLKSLRRGASRIVVGGPSGRNAARRLKRDGSILVKTYCKTLRQAAFLTFFERLFALWHIMHLPLFFLMLVAAFIHVVAVHLY